MSDEICEFCGRDPYHWVDIGVGYQPVAIVCCDEAVEAFRRDRDRRANADRREAAGPGGQEPGPTGIAQGDQA